jgi:hypothetical protein
LKVGDSSVKGLGKGLFLKKGSGLIKKGEVIAVYGGTVVDEVNGDYVLEVRRQSDCSSVWIDGSHSNSICDMLKASYSNEYIWDNDSNNTKFDGSGVLRARYDIDTRKQDVEVFTCYGSEYDWDAVKVLSISAVCEYIRQLASSLYDSHVDVEMLLAAVELWRESDLVEKRLHGNKVEKLLMLIFDGSLDVGECHYFVPKCGGSLEMWLERLVYCYNFYTQVAFRYYGRPGLNIDILKVCVAKQSGTRSGRIVKTMVQMPDDDQLPVLMSSSLNEKWQKEDEMISNVAMVCDDEVAITAASKENSAVVTEKAVDVVAVADLDDERNS